MFQYDFFRDRLEVKLKAEKEDKVDIIFA